MKSSIRFISHLMVFALAITLIPVHVLAMEPQSAVVSHELRDRVLKVIKRFAPKHLGPGFFARGCPGILSLINRYETDEQVIAALQPLAKKHEASFGKIIQATLTKILNLDGDALSSEVSALLKNLYLGTCAMPELEADIEHYLTTGLNQQPKVPSFPTQETFESIHSSDNEQAAQDIAKANQALADAQAQERVLAQELSAVLDDEESEDLDALIAAAAREQEEAIAAHAQQNFQAPEPVEYAVQVDHAQIEQAEQARVEAGRIEADRIAQERRVQEQRIAEIRARQVAAQEQVRQAEQARQAAEREAEQAAQEAQREQERLQREAQQARQAAQAQAEQAAQAQQNAQAAQANVNNAPQAAAAPFSLAGLTGLLGNFWNNLKAKIQEHPKASAAIGLAAAFGLYKLISNFLSDDESEDESDDVQAMPDTDESDEEPVRQVPDQAEVRTVSPKDAEASRVQNLKRKRAQMRRQFLKNRGGCCKFRCAKRCR